MQHESTRLELDFLIFTGTNIIHPSRLFFSPTTFFPHDFDCGRTGVSGHRLVITIEIPEVRLSRGALLLLSNFKTCICCAALVLQT